MKALRQKKILEIIAAREIGTQEELQEALKAEGFEARQATLSRDIRELRLLKIRGKSGRPHYVTAVREQEGLTDTFQSLFQDTVLALDRAENMVVVKCLPGMANAVCAAMDSLAFDDMVGTIAGDDTIFCLLRSVGAAEKLLLEWRRKLNR